MPSYRVSVAVHDLHPGVAPEEVLPAAVEAVAARHHVDADRLDVVRGVARIGVRFTVPPTGEAEEEARARATVEAAVDAVERLATWSDARLERRDGGRWVRRRWSEWV